VPANWLLAAGGGGGSGPISGNAGGDGGGLSGGDGVGSSCGKGGNQTGSTGSSAHLTGSTGTPPSGGGGGGYYGGGGATNCGAGGGSGYIGPTARDGSFPAATNTGNGSISITYFTLTVVPTGNGLVTGPGIDCGLGHGDCTESYAPGDPISLTTAPGPGYAFAGFTGSACQSSPCATSLSTDASVGALFAPIPQTTITKAPPAKTSKKAVSLAFESSEEGVTFECSLDSAPFTSCSSPLTFKVSKGKHAFAVRSVSSVGGVDPTPATVAWNVKKRSHKHKH
jgi:hypothetical protein